MLTPILPYKVTRKKVLPGRDKIRGEIDYLQSRLVYNPVLGLDFSLPSVEIDDKSVSKCKNVKFYNGEIISREGFGTIGGNLPLDSSLVGFKQFFDYSGNQYLISFTTDKAYKYNTSTKNWDDITQVASDFTGDADDFFEADNMYDDDAGTMKFFVTNGVDVPQVWDGTGVFADATVPVTLTKAKYVINFQHHLLYLHNTISGNIMPQRIDWSAQGTPEDFISSGSGNNNLAKGTDFITGAKIFKQNLAILKERSLTIVSYVGGVNPFSFIENAVEDIGCSTGNTACNIFGAALIFLGINNIYIFDGYDCKPIGEKIWKEFSRKINMEYAYKSHAILLEKFNLYLLFVPGVGSTVCNSVWIWDYFKDNWSYWEFDVNVIATNLYKTVESITIGQLTNKIKNLTWKFGDTTIGKSSPNIIFGDDSGNVYEFNTIYKNDNGVAIESNIETKNFILSQEDDNISKYARACQFYLYATGNSIDLYYSIDNGHSWTFIETLELDSSVYGPVISRKIDVTSQRIMFKLENNELDESFNIVSWDIKFIKKDNVVINEFFNKIKTTTLINIKDNEENQIYA
jgi:hypothetical protein